MARVTVEDCLEKVPNRFALVHLAARRAKQILKGSNPIVDDDNKEIVLALREVAAGFVDFSAANDSISALAEKELSDITSMSSDVKIKGMAGEVYTVDISAEEDVE